MKKWLNLENLIYATIFLLPIYLVKVKVFGLPTNVLEILIVAVFVWFILKRSFREFPACRQAGLKPSFRMAIGLIFLGLLFSALANKNYTVSFGIIKGWFVLPFLFALIVKNAISTEKRSDVYKVFYFSALFVAILSLGYYFLGIITFDGRLQGIFNSPNYLAMYLAPAIIIAVAQIKNAKIKIKNNNLKYKIICYISLITIIVTFYYTYSYAAWVAVIVALIILWLIKKDGQINFKKIAFAIALLLIVALAQWNTQKFADLKDFSERSSVRSRIMIWQATEKIIQDNWFWGIGPGNFQNKYLEYQKHFPLYLEWAVPHPHNLFLSFWLQSGLIGMIGFMSLIIIWFKNVFVEKKERDIIWLMSLGIMLYFIGHGLVDTTYFKNDLAVIFWINFFLSSVIALPKVRLFPVIPLRRNSSLKPNFSPR